MRHRTWIPLAFSVAVLGTCASTSMARSTPALLGRPNSGSVTCVNSDFTNGQVVNNCSNAVLWSLGLPLDSNGGHSGAFTVNVPTANFTSCRVVGIASNGTGASSSGYKTTAITNTWVNLNWGGVNVPASGMMFVDCFIMEPGARFSKNDHSPN